MKKSNSLTRLSLALALSAFLAIAQAKPARADLGSVMQDMAKQVMQITQNSTNPAQNAASATLCDTLLSDIATARGLMPPKVQQMPQDQQSGQMAQYQRMIDQLSSAVRQLKTDFLGNNASAIVQDLSQIDSIKMSGHQAFKGD